MRHRWEVIIPISRRDEIVFDFSFLQRTFIFLRDYGDDLLKVVFCLAITLAAMWIGVSIIIVLFGGGR